MARHSLPLALLVLLLASVSAAAAADPDGRDLAHRPGRLVVKYRGLDTCISCALQRRQPLGEAAGADSLDRLHRRWAVRHARPLFDVTGRERGRTAAYRRRVDDVRARFPARAARAPRDASLPDLAHVYVLELPADADVTAAAAAYAADPHVAYAHPDLEVRAGLAPNDAFFPDLYALHLTEAPAAWDRTTGAGTIVAVVDTGVDHQHPDLAANVWRNGAEVGGNGLDDDGNGFVDDVLGWDFVDGDGDPFDDNGHGTHVAGIAAAVGQNALGVIGMAFGAQVMAVKGLDAGGTGFVSDLAAAIVYAAENGADVVNNSWSGFGESAVLVDAIAAARALGAVVVASAGNNHLSVDRRQPAGIAGVIAVGASDANDRIADFSNYGDALSVAAPGVSVLSLRGSKAGGIGKAGVVATGYQRLSGTSMAAPHVAGLAALLLADAPGLTADEVRWHLELNADQPGIADWIGAPWNPFFGWGRINARRAFDAPPVTTRLSLRTPLAVHAITETLVPEAFGLDLAFTTHEPVSWTLAAPSWLAPTPTDGTDAAHVTLDLDTRGEPVGTLSAPVVVTAPAAVDGGAGFEATVEVHRDERVGALLAIDDDRRVESDVGAASDGVGSLVARAHYLLVGTSYQRRLVVTHLDGAGAATATFDTAGGTVGKSGVAVAFDGRQYLAVWAENDDRASSIMAARFAADGRPLDEHAFVVDTKKSSINEGNVAVGVGFDGAGYTVLWELLDAQSDVGKVYVRRVGVDGSLLGRKRVQIYPDRGGRFPQLVNPRLACIPGRCLAAWHEADGTTDPTGRFVRTVYGTVLIGDQPSTRIARPLLGDAHRVAAVAGDGTGFAVLALRTERCLDGGIGDGVVLARIAADGTSLDPAGIRLDQQAPGACDAEAVPVDLAFDGTQYLALFYAQRRGWYAANGEPGRYLFGVGVTPDGTVLESEPLGALWHERPVPLTHARLASSQLNTLAVWREQWVDRSAGTSSHTVRARRVRPRAARPDYPQATIGAIGSRSVAEREALVLTVRPPAGFDPTTTTLAASGMPPSAIFDAPTGAFRWQPSGSDAGVVATVVFEARDGAQVASETVTLTVTEQRLALSGRVRLANGTPVTDAGVRIVGVPREKRVAFTDAEGRYTVEGLAPRAYGAKLDPASGKRYRVLSAPSKLTLAGADGVLEDLVVEPR